MCINKVNFVIEVKRLSVANRDEHREQPPGNFCHYVENKFTPALISP